MLNSLTSMKASYQGTKEPMVSFYKNILCGMDRCQALRQAALDEMKVVRER